MARAATLKPITIRLDELTAARNVATAFPIEEAEKLRLSPETLVEKATEEAKFGRITIDDRGLTPGTRLHIVEPARALLARWRQARQQFDVTLQPKLPEIQAVQELDTKIDAARRRAEREETDAMEARETDDRYIRARDRFKVAEKRLAELSARHGNRLANTWAYNPLYWVALLSIGCAEWLINYDVFFSFAGVVAVAAGATLVMGVLLAFSAHSHGELLKQWSYRFGEHRGDTDRSQDWRVFALSTFSLLIVLAAACGSRYSIVMHSLAEQQAITIIPGAEHAEADPMRDVMLSLLWNVMAWAVGVFIAYMAHDEDPDFMLATRQAHRAERVYSRLRAPLTRRLTQIKAQLKKDIDQIETKAHTQVASVTTERDLMVQVNAHEAALLSAVSAVVRGNAETYRANLAQVLSLRPDARVERPQGEQIALSQFRDEPMNLSSEFIRELV
jgi:hypothetical protein